MFERFTDRARKVMALASREAQDWFHEYIGAEHLLIGMVKEGSGTGANILKQFGMTVDQLEKTMESLLKIGPDMVTMERLPQTPISKKVIEFAIENARAMGNNYVGTEHILLGLLDVDEGIAFTALTRYGITKDMAQKEINHLLGISDDDEEEKPPHCFVCAKFDMCLFAQTLNKVDANLIESLFGDLADETMAEVFKFCGDKCMKFERIEE